MPFNRREFLKSSAAATALVIAAPNSARRFRATAVAMDRDRVG